MKQEKEVKVLGKEIILKPIDFKVNVSNQLCRDAFFALTMSIFEEWFLSSDTKYLIFSNMVAKLKESGFYSKEELNEFIEKFNEAMKKFNTSNSFMG